MKQSKWLRMLVLCCFYFAACKKVIIEDYNFCENDCVEFQCKIIDRNSLQPINDLHIRILEQNRNRGFFDLSDDVIGYYSTNEMGLFKTRIPRSDFGVKILKIQLNIENRYPTIDELLSYPDTIKIIKL
jgi:hypothetical protein